MVLSVFPLSLNQLDIYIPSAQIPAAVVSGPLGIPVESCSLVTLTTGTLQNNGISTDRKDMHWVYHQVNKLV